MKKRWFALLLLTAVGASAQMHTLDFGMRGRATVFLLGDWHLTATDMAGRYSLTISPKKEAVNASCTLTVTFPEKERHDTKERLRTQVEVECRALAEGSAEGVARTLELSRAAGFGFYCNFTDPELRGKPPQKGNYKVTSIGKLRPHPGVLIEWQVLSDGFASEPHQQLLGAIEGLEFEPGRGR